MISFDDDSRLQEDRVRWLSPKISGHADWMAMTQEPIYWSYHKMVPQWAVHAKLVNITSISPWFMVGISILMWFINQQTSLGGHHPYMFGLYLLAHVSAKSAAKHGQTDGQTATCLRSWRSPIELHFVHVGLSKKNNLSFKLSFFHTLMFFYCSHFCRFSKRWYISTYLPLIDGLILSRSPWTCKPFVKLSRADGAPASWRALLCLISLGLESGRHRKR